MSKALEQNGAFILEYKQGDRWNTYSYYSATNINIDKDNSIVNSKAIQLRNKAFQTSNDDHHPNPKCHLCRSTIIENFLRQL